MKKFSFIFIFFMIFINSFGYINIYPTTFDKRIDNDDGVQSFYVTNNTHNTLSYRIFLEKTKEKNDMTEWIEIYPKSIKLETGETKEIKVQIISPKNVQDGEYISNLVIKEIENKENKENNTTKLKVFTELKIEISGYVGNLKPEFSIQKNKLKNIGKIRSKVEIFLSNTEDDYIYLDTLRLLTKEEQEISKIKNYRKYYKKYKYIELRDLEGQVLLKKDIEE